MASSTLISPPLPSSLSTSTNPDHELASSNNNKPSGIGSGNGNNNNNSPLPFRTPEWLWNYSDLIEKSFDQVFGTNNFAYFATTILIAFAIGLIFWGKVWTAVLGSLLLVCFVLLMISLLMSTRKLPSQQEMKHFVELYYTDPVTRNERAQTVDRLNFKQLYHLTSELIEGIPVKKLSLKKAYGAEVVQTWEAPLRHWVETKMHGKPDQNVVKKET